MNLLHYAAYYLRYPHYRDFLSLGVGIEARKTRCDKFWREHLERSMAFQSRCLQGAALKERAAVLGSGRLYDIDSVLLCEKFRQLSLYDADPGARLAANRLAKTVRGKNSVEFVLGDVSGTIQTWTNRLKEFLSAHTKGDTTALGKFLVELNACPGLALKGNSAVFSINLLSQIPLFWRDRVHQMVKKYWKVVTDSAGKYDATLQEALEHSQRALQAQHLSMLAGSNADLLIVVTDLNFQYMNAAQSRPQIEPALFIDKEIILPGYRGEHKDSWLWNIAPQNVEQEDYGVKHEVLALGFQRK